MIVVEKSISLPELKEIAKKSFGDLVKAVVDIEKKIMVIDAELHSDEETFLLDKGSAQKNIWGINLYPDLEGQDFIEFDSMINLRPSLGNCSRSIDDPEIQKVIINIVNRLVQR